MLAGGGLRRVWLWVLFLMRRAGKGAHSSQHVGGTRRGRAERGRAVEQRARLVTHTLILFELHRGNEHGAFCRPLPRPRAAHLPLWARVRRLLGRATPLNLLWAKRPRFSAAQDLDVGTT